VAVETSTGKRHIEEESRGHDLRLNKVEEKFKYANHPLSTSTNHAMKTLSLKSRGLDRDNPHLSSTYLIQSAHPICC